MPEGTNIAADVEAVKRAADAQNRPRNAAPDRDVPSRTDHCYRCPRPDGEPCPQTQVQGCAYLAPSVASADTVRPLVDAEVAPRVHDAWLDPDHPDAPKYVHAEIGHAVDPDPIRIQRGGVRYPDPADPASYQQPREQVLTTAASLICGDRQASYGDATESFARLGRLWSEVLGMEVTPEQVALCLVQLKVSRLVVSPTHEDSWVDIAGYAALGGEIAQRVR